MGELLALSSAFFFSCTTICVSKAQRTMNTNKGLFICLNVNLLFISILILMIWLFDNRPVTINWLAVFIFIIAGFFTGYLGRLLNFFAIGKVGPSRVSVIKLTIPLFAFVIAFSFLGETLTAGDIIASILIMGGMLLVNFHKKGIVQKAKETEVEAAQQEMASSAEGIVKPAKKGKNITSPFQVGILVALLSSIFYAVGNSFRKIGLMHWPDPFIGTFIGAVVGILFFMLAEMLRGKEMREYWAAFKQPGRGYFAIAGVLSILAQLSIFGAYTFSSLSIVTLLSFVESIFTIPLAYFFLKKQDHITIQLIFGAIVVIFGVSILFLY